MPLLSDVKVAGSMIDSCEDLVRTGPLDGVTPFSVSLDGSALKPVDVGGSFLYDEPDVWDPNAELHVKLEALSVTVKRHAEGRLADR